MEKFEYGLSLKGVCDAIDAYRENEDDVPEAGMIAAFKILLADSSHLRGLEDKLRIKQNHIRLRDTYIKELEERVESAEAQLAELAKQEPAYLYREHNPNNGMVTSWEEVDRESYEHLKTITDPETAEFREIFTRAAPAAAPMLQEDENGNPQGFIAWYERHFALQPYKGSSHVADCDEAWRAGILNNIKVWKC